MKKIVFMITTCIFVLAVSLCIILIAGIGFLVGDEFLTRDTYHQLMEDCINDGHDFRFCLDQMN